MKLDDGRQIDMPGPPFVDYFDCLHAKDKTKIGHKFPRGLIVDANGKSPAGTVVGARCAQRLPKMMGQ